MGSRESRRSTKDASPSPIDFNLCKRLGAGIRALIFRLKMLRRTARAAVEMHLTSDGAALEGRPVISEVKCFVPPSPHPPCVRAIDRARFMTDPDRRG